MAVHRFTPLLPGDEREEEVKMKRKSLTVILAVMVFAGIVLAQATATAGAAPTAIRILAPKPGDKLAQTAVTV